MWQLYARRVYKLVYCICVDLHFVSYVNAFPILYIYSILFYIMKNCLSFSHIEYLCIALCIYWYEPIVSIKPSTGKQPFWWMKWVSKMKMYLSDIFSANIYVTQFFLCHYTNREFSLEYSGGKKLEFDISHYIFIYIPTYKYKSFHF